MSIFNRFFRTFFAIFLPLLLLVNMVMVTGLSISIANDLSNGVSVLPWEHETFFGFDSIINALTDMPDFKPITHVINSVYIPLKNIGGEIMKIGMLSIDADIFVLIAHLIFLPVELLGYALVAILQIMVDIINVGMWLADIFTGKYNVYLPNDPYANWYNTNLI